MREQLNNELYRIDRAGRDQRRARAISEAKTITGFALICAAIFFVAAETVRIFAHLDELPMLWPAGWACLVVGYWLGRSAMRTELAKDYP